jgi:hypothetical protein
LEQREVDGSWSGRTIHDAPEIDGRITVTGDGIETPGLYEIIVTSAEGVDLTGFHESARKSKMPVSVGGALS